MKDTTDGLSNRELVEQVKEKQKRIRYRDVVLSVSAILLFFIIWECLVLFNVIDSRKLCDVLDIFKLFIITPYLCL